MYKLLASFALAAASLYPATISPLQFGVTHSHAALKTTVAFWPLPMGLCRLFGGIAQNWDDINTAPGVYDFTQLNQDVAVCAAHGAPVMIHVGFTPSWAAAAPNNPPSDMNADGTCTEAGGCAASYFSTYLTALCTNLLLATPQASIILEGWNEPNAGGVGSSSSTWTGTMAQLVSMEQTTAAIAHSYGFKVSSAPPGDMSDTNPANGYRGPLWFARFLAAGGGAAADYIGIHCYTAGQPGNPPEYIQTIAANALAAMTAAGLSKPLWNTESGWGPDAKFTDPGQQASYAARWALAQPGSGLAMSNWYASMGTGWGALYANGAWNAAGLALQQVLGWLANATYTAPKLANAYGTVWTAYVQHGEVTSLIVWDTSTVCAAGVCPTVSYTLPVSYGGVNCKRHDTAGAVQMIAGPVVQIGSQPLMFDLLPAPYPARKVTVRAK